jgi:methyl-accepting chemotaxis protein
VGAVPGKQRRNSVGFLLTVLGGLFGVLLMALATASTYSEWKNFRATQDAVEVNGAADALLVAIERLTLERGLTNTALNNEAAVATTAHDAIKSRRQDMQKAFAAAWPVLSQLAYLSEDGLAKKAEAAIKAADDLRQKADQMIARPKAERDGSVQQQWYPTVTRGIEALSQVWEAATQRLAMLDPTIASLNDIKGLTAAMREYTGRERALLGLGKPIEIEKRIEVADWRGRAALAWDQVTTIFPKSATPPAIADALNVVRDRFFGAYVPVRDKVYANLIAGSPAGVSPKEWADISNPGLNAIVGVRDAAISAGAAHLSERASNAGRALAIDLALMAAALILTIAVYLISRNRVSVPLTRIAYALRQMTDGKLDLELPRSKRNDEIGAICDALAVFREQSLRVGEIERERAAFEERTAAEQKAAMHKLADEFEAAIGKIVNSVSAASTDLEAAAGTLTGAAENTQNLSGMVATASEQASANVQSVAAATEEMNASIDEIARQVQESSNYAGEAVKQAEKTDTRIAQLAQAASRIGDVVKLITEIAEQTNLLALNATIEAARAGEAGRGFAVVAQEVKALATQTAKATGEIGAQVAEMQTATEDSVSVIKEIGSTIGRISEIASAIAASVEEQGAATSEIARNVGEAARGTSQVAINITDVNRGAGETGAASAGVLASAQSLSGESRQLKLEVEKFLNTVRAA